MAPRWSLVDDVRDGTITIREKKEKYLPRFEAESDLDWAARVSMTFVADHYATNPRLHPGRYVKCASPAAATAVTADLHRDAA